MIPLITEDNAWEYALGEFAIDASDLRLDPGVFPAYLETNLGNGQPFEYYHAKSLYTGVPVYRQVHGSIFLTVRPT